MTAGETLASACASSLSSIRRCQQLLAELHITSEPNPPADEVGRQDLNKVRRMPPSLPFPPPPPPPRSQPYFLDILLL